MTTSREFNMPPLRLSMYSAQRLPWAAQAARPLPARPGR